LAVPAPAAAPGRGRGQGKPGAKAKTAAAAPQAKKEAKDAQAAARPARANSAKPLPAASQPSPAREQLAKQVAEQVDRAALKRELDLLVPGNVLQDAKRRSIAAVRVYAHAARADRQPGERVDFTETLYWHAGVRTAAETGEATFAFSLNDSVTSFRITADAFDANGALGSATSTIDSVEPFYIEPKLPLEVTQHDTLEVPFALVNSTDESLPISSVNIQAPGAHTVDLPVKELAPGQRARGIISIDVGEFTGAADVMIAAAAGAYRDQVTRKLNVVPLGFPVEIAHGGMLFADETTAHEVVIPDDIVPGSIRTQAKVFPTPLGNLTAALERLIREPNGCFEQTSSSTYPLIMAQQYFQSHTGVDPALIERSSAMLDKGYKRLIGYECKEHGFEWFGADPGHEALTAYGLMEFTDMSQVRDVDADMLARTRQWLLGTRDGKGGFKRQRRALHTWVTDPDVSNAYITWALLSAGETDLTAEVDQVVNAAQKSQNTYVLALAANVAVLGGRKDAALGLRDRLIKLQESDGGIQGATQSIVGSGGDALRIEATALAALAWTSDVDYIDHADAAIRYLASACKAGRYGSTQSTVLTLKAIVAYDKSQAKPKSPGTIQLVIDSKPIGAALAFDRETQGTIELPQFGEHLKPGKHTIGLRMVDGSSMPHAVSINLFSTKPASSEKCELQVVTKLRDKKLTEGDVTEVDLQLANLSDKVVTNPIAIVGIPGGLEVRHDQLKELVKSKKIAAYEVIGRDVVFYWRELAADSQVRLPISVIGAVPGDYTGPASRAYLYYTDEHKHWVGGLSVSIAPKR
ncbi:MAG: A-macroglobulin complement component, partial [Planctomycetota bacterium]|nr:A-macroglobulin complement component [Planctomycetota bacterium]